MDLNYLLHREQVERVRADLAGSDPAKVAHRELADLYRQQIESYRRANLDQGSHPRQG